VLIIGTPYISHNSGSKFNLLGNALIVLAIATDILGTILIKPALKKVPIVQMTAIRFMIAVLLFIPFVIPGLSDLRHIHISPASYVALGFNFIFATLVAFYLYHWGFSKINGEQLSPLYYLDPMVGSVASIIILGERPTITLLGGVVLVFCGLYFGEAHKLKTGHHIGHHR
jgi:drug/metabolite transporter (DMT)-like permease